MKAVLQRPRLLLVSAVVWSALLVTAVNGATPASATPCKPEHCYALAIWNTSSRLLGGLNVYLETPEAEVVEPNFVDNEAWIDEFEGRKGSAEDWVEGGATSGAAGSAEGPTYPFWNPGWFLFTAEAYTGHYYEQDYPNTGIPGSAEWALDIHYVPAAGAWYVTTSTAIGTLGTWGHQPASAGRIEAGLEETSLDTVNWGTAYDMSWWDAENGVEYKGWSGDGTKAKLFDEKERTCGDLRSSEEFYWQANAGPCS